MNAFFELVNWIITRAIIKPVLSTIFLMVLLELRFYSGGIGTHVMIAKVQE